ncbi:MAG: hypothetical protein KA715_08470 [Xanthomonadaceae bacterium]|nr:hypothetical protein [Xanthomonadaceae bacterium]
MNSIVLLFVFALNSSHSYESFTFSDIEKIVPSDRLPRSVRLRASNNNVAIEQYKRRLFMAWRNSATHFASKKARIIVMSSGDDGKTWEHETILSLNRDVREPYFLVTQDELVLSFFEAGTNPIKFEPNRLLRTRTHNGKEWSEVEEWGEKGEIVWEIKKRKNKYYATSYIGNHYHAGASRIEVILKESNDGFNWSKIGADLYVGGVSEVGFEFKDDGTFWAVGRNEDGDASGYGSQIFTAATDQLNQWESLKKSDPKRYDSPRLFKHGDEIYMIARRDVGRKPFGLLNLWLPDSIRKWIILTRYSLRPKRTALYHINTAKRKVEWMSDLPSGGDTAFASIIQKSEHEFLIANYSSDPEEAEDVSWLDGQMSSYGTGIYFINLKFDSAK